MHLIGATPDGLPDGTFPDEDEAHEKGLWHFSAHMLVVVEGNVVVRRRASDEARYPGLLTTTIAGHVDAHRTPFDTLSWVARRHEVGFDELRYVGTFKVDDEEEREICTLWEPIGFDASATTASYLEVPIDVLNEHKATPHLLAAIDVWRGRC